MKSYKLYEWNCNFVKAFECKLLEHVLFFFPSSFSWFYNKATAPQIFTTHPKQGSVFKFFTCVSQEAFFFFYYLFFFFRYSLKKIEADAFTSSRRKDRLKGEIMEEHLEWTL